MWKRIQRLLDVVESRWSLWTALKASGILGVGAVTGWLSSTVSWIGQFGAFGWWASFLLGSLLAASIYGAFGFGKARLAEAKVSETWTTKRTDAFNPLEDTFVNLRINIHDLVNPAKKIVKNKVFRNCELIGPANIFIVGGALDRVGFGVCDFIEAKDGAFVQNVIVFENCQFINGDTIFGTIYTSPSMAAQIRNTFAANFVT